jgi:fatty-acyl-CoA synthase
MASGVTAFVRVAAAVGASAPALVLAAAAGTKFGLIEGALGYETITLQWAFGVAALGVAMGAVALVLSLRKRRAGLMWALVALLAPSAVLAGVLKGRADVTAAAPVHEASTDWVNPPSFSDVAVRARAGARNAIERRPAAAAHPCRGAKPIPRLVDPEEAALALERNGVQVTGRAPWRVEGVHETFWFGIRSDVAVRLEPGRSDVRVLNRDLTRDAGLSCRLVTGIVRALD